MEQAIVILCVVLASAWAWGQTGSVIYAILAAIVGGFIGSIISFQIHESRRARILGLSSRKELRQFDKDTRDLQDTLGPLFKQQMEELDRQARAEGYASFDDKAAKEFAEKYGKSPK